MKYLFSILSIFLFMSSCGDCETDGLVIFELPVTLSPALDTFHVGDTISVVSSFSDEVYDQINKREFKLINFKFYLFMGVRELSDTQANNLGILNFDIIVGDGNLSYFEVHLDDGRNEAGYDVEYNYMNNSYNLSYKLVPRVKGLYVFIQNSLLGISPGGKWQHFEGKCPGTSIDAVTVLNRGSDNNIDLLKDSPDPHYSEWIFGAPQRRFYDNGLYAFYVVE